MVVVEVGTLKRYSLILLNVKDSAPAFISARGSKAITIFGAEISPSQEFYLSASVSCAVFLRDMA